MTVGAVVAAVTVAVSTVYYWLASQLACSKMFSFWVSSSAPPVAGTEGLPASPPELPSASFWQTCYHHWSALGAADVLSLPNKKKKHDTVKIVYDEKNKVLSTVLSLSL